MKKILACLLAIAMILAFAACEPGAGPSESTPGGNIPPASSTTEGAVTPPVSSTTKGTDTPPLTFDFSAMMAGNAATDVIWGKQDEATKAALVAEGKKDGVDISFGADGSMTVVDPAAGDTVVQKPDGTWVIKSDDGSEGQLGGNWPDNEFTRLIPKPDFTLTAANTTDTDFSVAFTGAAVEEIRAYAEKVKAAGFTLEAELEDQSIMGMVIYNYTAKNAAGYTVTVSFAMGNSAIIVEKP